MKVKSFSLGKFWIICLSTLCMSLILMLTPFCAISTSTITITVNGVDLECDALPFIEKGTTMVPLRSIFEALGAVVSWNGVTRTITAERSADTVITMQIGNGKGTIRDTAPPWETVTKTLNVPPKIVNGITFVPARFVSEAFGADVTWDSAANTVIIKNKGIGKSYYVAMDGDDMNPGTLNKPWKSFAKAASSVEPGNTVYVREGTYKERLMIKKSGALGAPINYLAYPGETAIIDGNGLAFPDHWGGLIEIGDNASFTKVSGFHVINSIDKAIFVHGCNEMTIDGNYTSNSLSSGIAVVDAGHLTIDNNHVTLSNLRGEGSWEAIRVSDCETVQVSNNHVSDSVMEGIDIIDSEDVKVYSNEVSGLQRVGIYVCGWDKSMSHVEVYDNLVHDNGDGICVNSENGAFVEGVKIYRNQVYDNGGRGLAVGWGGQPNTAVPVHNVVFYGNTSHHNGGEGIVIYGREKTDMEDIHFYNNLIFNNEGAGISVGGVTTEPFLMRGLSFVNNTIHGNGTENIWGSGGVFMSNAKDSEGIIDNIKVQNNIISGNHHFSIAIWPWGKAPTNVTISYNLIGDYREDEGYGELFGEKAVMSSPSFMDASNENFQLSPNSAAIDQGMPDGVINEDFYGVIRPQGGGVDIGAVEFISTLR